MMKQMYENMKSYLAHLVDNLQFPPQQNRANLSEHTELKLHNRFNIIYITHTTNLCKKSIY